MEMMSPLMQIVSLNSAVGESLAKKFTCSTLKGAMLIAIFLKMMNRIH